MVSRDQGLSDIASGSTSVSLSERLSDSPSGCTSGNTRPDAPNDPSPNRIMFISMSQWLLDFFFERIALSKQPNVMMASEDVHVFRAAYSLATTMGLLDLPTSDWSEPMKCLIRDGAQQDLELVEGYSAMASSQQKTLVACMNPWAIINPAAVGKSPVNTHTGIGTELWNFFRTLPGIEYGSNPSIPLGAEGTIYSVNNCPSQVHFTYSVRNNTILPDQYIRTWRPIFLIWDPLWSFPKIFRELRKTFNRGGLLRDAISQLYDFHLSFRWIRLMYDWCLEQADAGHYERPIILRGMDLLNKSEGGIIWNFCEKVGLDTECVLAQQIKETNELDDIFQEVGEEEGGDADDDDDGDGDGEWEDDDEDELAEIEFDREARDRDIHQLIDQGLDVLEAYITVLRLEWVVEFGAAPAQRLEESVRASKQDFKYLDARAWTG
ncbi:hypothetical protein BDV12DRAFT_196814 [Aspergillus spectabilis]